MLNSSFKVLAELLSESIVVVSQCWKVVLALPSDLGSEELVAILTRGLHNEEFGYY